MLYATSLRSGDDKAIPVVLLIYPQIYCPLDSPSLLYGPQVFKRARTMMFTSLPFYAVPRMNSVPFSRPCTD
ncbi:hypothetical protein SCLCIDRAFT_272362 [Scleroderma citrinum Foug A]|uniref:Uncharacterized protein n=1 Tax=Scleroderma citrinum Foug A TaxID=1036808 RepID=A0A0C3DIW8_9AGAM|nr:hypothetical protein SCLCIDRAFT_272362 [Scleroderma citrinum Foug A]